MQRRDSGGLAGARDTWSIRCAPDGDNSASSRVLNPVKRLLLGTPLSKEGG